MKKQSIDKALEAFQLRDLQSFRTILITLEQNEFTIDQALKYIHFLTLDQTKLYERTCPDCTHRLYLDEVNTTACTQVGGKYRTQWFCPFCGYSELSRKSIPEQNHKLKIGRIGGTIDKTTEYEFLRYEIERFLRRPLPANCPACNKIWHLFPVNVPQGKANIRGYKSMWFCDYCGNEKYLKHNMREEAVRLRRI